MPIEPPTQYAKKRLIVCCDGTGQANSHGVSSIPSNVARFARALQASEKIPASKDKPCDEEIQQVVLYQTGIGTDTNTSYTGAAAGMAAEAFGYGLDDHVLEAYYFFVNNYEHGDEIYIFGFSRGAFTARAIASFLCRVGLLKNQYVDYLPVIFEAYKLRRSEKKTWKKLLAQETSVLNDKIHPPGVNIDILGVWDTVASIGIPETWASNYLGWTGARESWNKHLDHHDMDIVRTAARRRKYTRPFVRAAFQALALDEHRIAFTPTLFFDPTPISEQADSDAMLQQCWFPGVHTDIGGSYARGYRDISDIALAWMIDRCSPKLAFDRDALSIWIKEPSYKFDRKLPGLKAPQYEDDPPRWGLSKLHDSFNELKWRYAGSRIRTPGQYFLGKFQDEDNTQPYGATNEFIHPSVRVRLLENKNLTDSKDHYLPPSMKGFVLKPYQTKAGDSGWKWVKEVEVDGQKHTVELREFKIYRGRGYLEEEMLTEEAKERIDDPEADKNVQLVADDEVKTWGQTLRSWMPF
ncbi:hypothetical protein ONZ45_g2327 [Pleurotus djamor]|nr:hypothetical protein ONZ45_g2327 [Pleurotus djamor]